MTPSVKEQSAAKGLTSPAHAAWEAVLERARRELPAAVFNLWFADLAPGSIQDDVVELVAPNGYVKNWLVAHHLDLITKALSDVLGPNVRLKLKAGRGRAPSSWAWASW